MNIDMFFYNVFTRNISGKSVNEMVQSQMPGRANGPADAYRHLLLSAELTRQFGEDYARSLLNGHELTGRDGDDWTPEAEAMDRYNNEIGVDIGKSARSWEEVIQKSREMMKADDPDGVGAHWLPEEKWQVNPKDEATGLRIPNRDSRLNWPPISMLST